jgi:pimeloyl-CoA synthetase
MEDNDKRNKEKLEFFLAEKVKVHVERLDRRFWNGYVIGKKSDKIFTFKEDMLGEKLLFVADIWEVNEYVQETKKSFYQQ